MTSNSRQFHRALVHVCVCVCVCVRVCVCVCARNEVWFVFGLCPKIWSEVLHPFGKGGRNGEEQ